jgi:DNA polymerase III sliding clamp (beta) subunit (PCNA family)
MRIAINEITYKKIIDGVKHCLSKDEYRKVLQYIQVKVTKETITAYALDGFRAARVQVKAENPEITEFECFIKPIAYKPSKRGINPVWLEYDGENAYIEVMTEYGKARYCFIQPTEKYIDIDKIYQDNKAHDREICFNAVYGVQALKALASTSLSRYKEVIFESKNDKLTPFIIRAESDNYINEQLILPVRKP